MEQEEKAPEPEVARAEERIVESITAGGPQDVYQLNGKAGDLVVTAKAVRLLVEKELIEERSKTMPTFSGDPYATVYGFKPGSAPGTRLRSW